VKARSFQTGLPRARLLLPTSPRLQGQPGKGSRPEAVVELAGGIRREVLGRAAVGEERERLWRYWSDLDKHLDGYAARRPQRTAVVVLEPRMAAD
jgi:hypothetical protein